MNDNKDKNKEKKDQFVIAYIADWERCEATLSYAVSLARMIGKGLILLHVSDPHYTDIDPDEAQQHLVALRDSCLASLTAQPTASTIPVTYAALRGDTQTLVTALPTLLGAVAVVAQVDKHAGRRSPLHPRQILHIFKECKTAFLVAQRPLPEGATPFAHVALSIDHKKESKDKYIWTSYFARFGGSTIHTLYYDYKDEFLKNKWYSNMKFLHKFFNNLNLSFQPHIIPSKSTFTDVNALNYAAQQGYDLLVSVTTKERDAVEFFIGTQEQRLIDNAHQLPILFLNPREDLYVLCD